MMILLVIVLLVVQEVTQEYREIIVKQNVLVMNIMIKVI